MNIIFFVCFCVIHTVLYQPHIQCLIHSKRMNKLIKKNASYPTCRVNLRTAIYRIRPVFKKKCYKSVTQCDSSIDDSFNKGDTDNS